jgi:hypothetical protein
MHLRHAVSDDVWTFTDGYAVLLRRDDVPMHTILGNDVPEPAQLRT